MIPDTPLTRQATALMEQLEKEPQHVRHVTTWSVFLFEKLAPLHQLSRKELELLIAGSLLHDIGWSTATEERPHHKESARLIREHTWKGLPRSQTDFIALLARYHRKSVPSPAHRRYLNLPKTKKKHLHYLAGILRVADALDRSHRQSLHPADLEIRPGVCLIHSTGQDTGEAQFGLERKGDLFQQVFGHQPFLKPVS